MKNKTAQKEIPQGWELKTLGNLGEFKTGGIDKKINQNEKPVKLINYMDVYRNKFIDSSIKFMEVTANEREIETSQVKLGDMLFTPSSETPNDIGHSSVVAEDLPNTLFSYHLARLRFNEKYNNKIDVNFRAFFCNSRSVLKQFEKISTGATRYTISKGKFESIQVLIPVSKEEQRKIAGILGTVDENIEKTQEVIEATEKLKRGLMQQLFTRGIGHTKFKKTKMEEIPERWEVAQLGDLFNSIIGGGTPSRKESKYWSGDIPWMTVKDMTKKKYVYDTKEYITEIGLKDSSSSLIPENNLITSTRMGIGRVYINKIPVAINQDLKGLVPKKEFVLDYVYWLILSVAKRLETKGTGSTVKGIRLEDFKSLDIALTKSRNEQKQIAEILSAVDEKISINKKLKVKLTLLKKGLMQDLLSGGVRVI